MKTITLEFSDAEYERVISIVEYYGCDGRPLKPAERLKEDIMENFVKDAEYFRDQPDGSE